MRTRVKICGITREQDMFAAADAGADALGFVFYAPSPRSLDVAAAIGLIAKAPAFVTTVALFVDADPELVETVIERTAVDVLQFHGDEPADYCRNFGRSYIKAIRMQKETELPELIKKYQDGQALLVDSYSPTVAGGTGETFDWSHIPPGVTMPLILAGGLGPDNVGRAIEQVHPYAVDVSSGVEQKKGIKDAAKMAAFIEAVRVSDESIRTSR
ncbi:MAG: phosphoribosylanthranilate isomerase [Proteobacteria bacterium]|nr:phosphoribosylanthranilate isomerase [Pseudomonadota bacterium]